MDNQDPKDVLGKLVIVLRKLTRLVKAIPFTYLIIYSIYLLLGLFCCETVISWLDSLIIISPATTVTLLGLSRILKLCKWHKTACVFPLTTQAESFVDNNIIQFTQGEIVAINLIIAVAVMFFLMAAYKHFYNGRERAH